MTDTVSAPEGYICSDLRSYSMIFMNWPAKSGNTNHLAASVIWGWLWGWLRFRGWERQPTMRTLLVLVADVLPKDSLDVPFAEDKDVVQTSCRTVFTKRSAKAFA